MDFPNVSENVSRTAAAIDEHRHRSNIRRRARQNVIELFDKCSKHLDVVENITVNNSKNIINIESTLQKLNKKLLVKRQPDKSDVYLHIQPSLEKGNIPDTENIQNAPTFPSNITIKESKGHNVEHSTIIDGQSSDSSPLLLNQTVSKSIKSVFNHEMVIQQRPNVDVYSEICMNETIVHPTNNVSFETEYESIYEDVIPETSNTENGPFETCSVLSVRIGSESCSSDENSLTIEKHRVTLYPEKKDKDTDCDNTKEICERHNDLPTTCAESNNKQGKTERGIQLETSSSGYCTLSRQLEVSAGYHETRDVSILSTRASQTSLATITSTGEALPTNASYEVKQCDEVENQIMSDDISIDEEERLLEEKVVELTKKKHKIQRDERKRILHKTIAELEKFVNEKENIQSPQGETNIVYELIDEDTRMKEFVNRHYHLIPPDYRFEYHDVLILYDSDNDHEEAEKFKLHLQNDFKLTNGCKVKAALYDGPEMETRTNRTFEHLEKSFERCTLKFIFLTSSFLENDRANVYNESFICEAMYKKEYRYSIVPIYAHDKIKAPFGLNNLSGFRYYNRDNNYGDRMLKLLEENVCKREEKERALIKLQYNLVQSILENK